MEYTLHNLVHDTANFIAGKIPQLSLKDKTRFIGVVQNIPVLGVAGAQTLSRKSTSTGRRRGKTTRTVTPTG